MHCLSSPRIWLIYMWPRKKHTSWHNFLPLHLVVVIYVIWSNATSSQTTGRSRWRLASLRRMSHHTVEKRTIARVIKDVLWFLFFICRCAWRAGPLPANRGYNLTWPTVVKVRWILSWWCRKRNAPCDLPLYLPYVSRIEADAHTISQTLHQKWCGFEHISY